MRYEVDDRVGKIVSIEHYIRLVKCFYICRVLHTELINTLEINYLLNAFLLSSVKCFLYKIF